MTLPQEENDLAFRTKLAIGADLAVQAQEAGFVFRAVVAHCANGDQDRFRAELAKAGLPFVMASSRAAGSGPTATARTPRVDAARDLTWDGPTIPATGTR